MRSHGRAVSVDIEGCPPARGTAPSRSISRRQPANRESFRTGEYDLPHSDASGIGFEFTSSRADRVSGPLTSVLAVKRPPQLRRFQEFLVRKFDFSRLSAESAEGCRSVPSSCFTRCASSTAFDNGLSSAMTAIAVAALHQSRTRPASATRKFQLLADLQVSASSWGAGGTEPRFTLLLRRLPCRANACAV